MMLYECGIRYERTMPNGMSKKVTELYLVDACSFAEAEGRITKEMEPYISGDFDVVTIKRTNYSEIVDGLSTADKWFKAKLVFITVDEKSGKEKKTGRRNNLDTPICMATAQIVMATVPTKRL